MDKFFLLLYTGIGYDGFRHSFHAWFETEEELRIFVCKGIKEKQLELELAIEILSHREIRFDLTE